jgi:hypothetical protein
MIARATCDKQIAIVTIMLMFYFYLTDRYYWDPWDPHNVAEGLFAIANIISFTRLSYMLPAKCEQDCRQTMIKIDNIKQIRVITKLPNSEQSYKGKVKTRMYINRQNQSTTGCVFYFLVVSIIRITL